MLTPVRVDRVTHDTNSNRFILILKDDANRRMLPFVVGSAEAQQIALKLENKVLPRPAIYDILVNILRSVKAQIHRAVISDIRENVYQAIITLKHEKSLWEIAARPSDAIVLALHTYAPIFVSEEIMQKMAAPDKEG